MQQSQRAETSQSEPAAPAQVLGGTLWQFAVAVELVLLASFVNFLRYHDQPLLRPDSVVAGTFLIAGGLVFSALYVWRNRYWRALLQALLIFLAVDFNADILWLAGALGLATVGFVALKARSILSPLSFFAAVVMITGLVGIGETKPLTSVARKSPQGASGDRPAILHLILDEHIGIEGLAWEGNNSRLASSELKRAYLAMGFRVYGRAYSRHYHTVNAIPWIVNLGLPPQSEGDMERVRVGPNTYFQGLARSGYRINIVQSDFAEFCADSSYSVCTTYFQASLQAPDRHRFTTGERVELIVFKFLDLSDAISGIWRYADRLPAQVHVSRASVSLRARTTPLAALAAFDGLIADLKTARAGDVFFAHLLLPHYPFALRRDCSTLPLDQWGARLEASIEYQRLRYVEQVRCTTRKVKEAVASLEQSAAGKNFIVIVHGDHGSRITAWEPNIQNRGRYGPHDMIAGFSTLFAVRGRGIDPGYEDRPAPVDSLLAQFVEREFKTAPSVQGRGTRLPVFLDDRQWKPRAQANLPQQWSSSAVSNGDESQSKVP